MKTDIYQTVTNAIIEALESSPPGRYQLPWHHVTTLPQNARTQNLYNGVNIPLLWAHQYKYGYTSGLWATYKQWQELGAQVKKGAKGTPIVFWKAVEIEPATDNAEAETRMFARWSRVFNADQVDGFSPPPPPQPEAIQTIAAADRLVDASGADIRHGTGGAYYNPLEDYIRLPAPESFKAANGSSATGGYYSTLFHELTHWTGAKHRLDRDMGTTFGKQDYAFEELVAELGAAFLCARTGVQNAAREDHALYIRHWLQALKNDKRFIFAASAQAQKATDYLLTLQDAPQPF